MVDRAASGPVRQPFSTVEAAGLRALLREHGQAPYRGEQAYRHFWGAHVDTFSDMHTLPVEVRAFLEERFFFSTVRPVVRRQADRGRTIKYLLELSEGRRIESVLMHQEPSKKGRPRITLCVSSQVGCPIGCSFCATGQSGFERNLSEAEIIDQFLLAARELHASGQSLTNVVFMGMGEPMNNYAAVVAAIRRLALKETMDFSPRRVTVSTIGLIPFMERLSEDVPNVNLAVSLHAPDDELRSQLIPVNRKYPIGAVVRAARAHAEKTGRRVSYEYVLLSGVNDRLEQAERLAEVVGSRLAHVNLIPMNSVEGSSLRPPSSRHVLAFQARLQGAGVPTTVRVTRGLDIDAACGQLRAREPQLLALTTPPVT
jgi:23S rRNA (adenine2503-C2)-methyltransferase